MDIPPEQQDIAQREVLTSTLSDTFCEYNSRVLSIGSVVQVCQVVVVVVVWLTILLEWPIHCSSNKSFNYWDFWLSFCGVT